KKHLLFLLIPIIFLGEVNGQQTVGLFQNDSLAFDGYTLFSPSLATTSYMIDNCGREVNKWQHTTLPGLATYFLEDGSLLRAGRSYNTNFNGGGAGGIIEKYDWNGSLLWSYNYSSPLFRQHHDIAAMPNGNVLLLAWELISDTVAINAGRNPNTVSNGLWPEHVVEIEPIGLDSGIIVWEWHIMDHLIQDYDSAKNNFGVIADNPELIDFNFTNSQIGNPDWCHANALDYNPALDQIMINSRNFHEFWIIDHSTTTAEAAGHSGGNSGKGGDILYRWGNPAAYDRGGFSNQQLFAQHDAHWIDTGLPNEGKIMVFNNGPGRPGGLYSTVEILNPPVDSLGNYTVPTTGPFAPTSADWTYSAAVPTDFYASFISGAQQLMNGNVLICNGPGGTFFEVDTGKVTHWEYINPVGSTGPVMQGNTPILNDNFRAYRYGPNYSGFNGLTLLPGNPIELSPYPSNCLIFTDTETIYSSAEADINIYGSINGHINVKNNIDEPIQVFIYDLSGKLLSSKIVDHMSEYTLSTNFKPGIYICKAVNIENEILKVEKIILR
ncbi:MAG: aryl-sulfate sulfotransferase, partial [Bacteroidia bacterium]|nr:aryl-sulfate sulfotransferase [Bacteroidia bacterium]